MCNFMELYFLVTGNSIYKMYLLLFLSLSSKNKYFCFTELDLNQFEANVSLI